jgi:hypothetical protein
LPGRRNWRNKTVFPVESILSENPAVCPLVIKRGGKDPDYDLNCGKIKGND